MGLFLGGAWWIQRTSPALAWWGLAFALFAGAALMTWLDNGRHGTANVIVDDVLFLLAHLALLAGFRTFTGKAVPWGIAVVALAGYAVFTPAHDGPAREMVRVAIALSGAITIIALVDLIRWREEPRTWWRIGEAVLLGHLVVLALHFVAGPLLDGDAADTSEQAVDIVLLVAPIVIPIALGTTLLAMVYERRTAALRSDALRDPLTGALNRRGVEHWLAYERQCPRGGRRTDHRAALAVIAVDLDHFKRINDTHGHSVGDAILQTVVSRLSAEVRPADAVARFGGEEFLVLMAWIDVRDALSVAERMRAALAADPVGAGTVSVAISASFGVALERDLPAPSALPDLLDRADHALYRAKTDGRNRVVAADQLPEAA